VGEEWAGEGILYTHFIPPKIPLEFLQKLCISLLPIKLLAVPILINEFSESYLIHCVTNNWRKADDES
jgi:hypothetical protein